MTKRDRELFIRWEQIGFNLCASCGKLARRQSAINANSFASVAIERPQMAALVCDCDAPTR